MVSESQKRASEKYDKTNTRKILLKLNINTDKDILQRLDKVGNKQGYIKKLIREDIERDRDRKRIETQILLKRF